MRYLTLALVGLFATISPLQAQWHYHYAPADSDATGLVATLPLDTQNPMIPIIDGHIGYMKQLNDAELDLFTQAVGLQIRDEAFLAAARGLARARDFATQLIVGEKGARLVDQMAEVDRIPVAWLSAQLIRADAGGTANRVDALLRRGLFILDSKTPQIFLEGKPVLPVATHTVTLKWALALLAAAHQTPEDFQKTLDRTNAFFWTVEPLPEAVQALVIESGYPFVRGAGERLQIGFPTAGFALGSRSTLAFVDAWGPRDASSFLYFPDWAGRVPPSTLMMAAVAKRRMAEAAGGPLPAWPDFGDAEERRFYEGLCDAWSAYVDLVDPSDIQPGDLFVRRWETGGTAGIVRGFVTDPVEGRLMIVAEASRSDPTAPVNENGLEFDGQGYRAQTLDAWLGPMNDKPVSAYFFRLKPRAFEDPAAQI